jgi:hypothetical protein
MAVRKMIKGADGVGGSARAVITLLAPLDILKECLSVLAQALLNVFMQSTVVEEPFLASEGSAMTSELEEVSCVQIFVHVLVEPLNCPCFRDRFPASGGWT